jgi:hypothetical protein
MRECVSCQRRLGEQDLLVRECLNMEEARVSSGLEGVRFRYYSCPRCGEDHVFLEVVPLPGETGQDVRGRKAALTRATGEVRAFRTRVLVVEAGNGQG